MLPEKAEVAVIGGGIVGVSAAYHLALRGADVVLLERRRLTCGTTWHAAGLVGQLRATLNLTRLAQYSAALYAQLTNAGHATGYRRTGSISVAGSAARLHELRRQASMAASFGLPVETLTAEEVVARYPLLDPLGLHGGVWLPTDGQTDPTSTTLALAAAARGHGARIIEDVEVTHLLREAGRVAGVATTAGDVQARRVVLAAGMWSRDFAAAEGVAVPLQAAEHFYLVTEPISGLPRDLPVLRDPDNCLYVKEDAGKLLVGCFEPRAKPWGLDGIPKDFAFDQLPEDFDHFRPLLEAAMQRLPVLQGAGIKMLFNGPESFTPDVRYILGEAPELPGLFVAAGFNSIGIQSAGGAGRAIADWLLDGTPGMDLWDVDIRRFEPFQANPAYLHARTAESLGLLYAMHWPHRQPETARGARRSVLHGRLAERGACFGEMAGWERANWFAADGATPREEYTWGRQNWQVASSEEQRAVREAVGLFDQSSFGKFLVQGRDARVVLDRLAVSAMDVPVGRIVYTQWCNERGGIEADVTVTRLASNEFLVVTGAATRRRDLETLRAGIGEAACTVADMTSAYAVLSIMGPRSRAVLSRLTRDDLGTPAFPYRTSREISLGYARVRASRITYVGELGWELYVPGEYATDVFDRLLQAGAPEGLRLCGYHALNGLRLEKAYRHWGHDVDSDSTPLEAGLGFCIGWDKPDFAGRSALLSQRQTGVRRRLLQFRLIDPEAMLFHDEPIWRDGTRVGRITSGAWGATLGTAIGLGWVEHEAPVSTAGLRAGCYEVEIAGCRVPAAASLRPLYDPAGERLLA